MHHCPRRVAADDHIRLLLDCAQAAGQKLANNPEIKAAIERIKAEGRQVAAYDLARAMQESMDVIEFAKANKNAMAYFKAVEHRAKLSGLLVEQIHLKAEVVDIREALEAARARAQRTIIHVDAPVSLPALSPVNEPTQASARETWDPFAE